MKFVVAVVLSFLFCEAVVASSLSLRMKIKESESASAINSYLNSMSQSAMAEQSAAVAAAVSQSAAAAASLSSIPATQLVGSEQSAASSNCISQACGEGSGMSVSDAVRPIDDWMKDFKARTSGSGGNDLMAAAKAVVRPLITKLKATQQAAIEKLEESDEGIRMRVEEQATQHVYNLLRAEHITNQKSERAADRKEKLETLKSEAAEKQLETKLAAEHSAHSEHSEHSKKL